MTFPQLIWWLNKGETPVPKIAGERQIKSFLKGFREKFGHADQSDG